MKIAVVTDSESAAGYRLAGLDVAVAADGADARKVLAGMIQEGGYVLILVNDVLLSDPHQVVKQEMRGRDLPVLLATPSPLSSVAGKEADAESYMQRLILSTMGHEIKL
jgi:V/A-type H+-transporting ATPase subunit F